MLRIISTIVSLVLTALLIHAAFKSLDQYAARLFSTPGDRIIVMQPANGVPSPPQPGVRVTVAPEKVVQEKYPPFEMSSVDLGKSQRELAKFATEMTGLYRSSNFKALEKKAAEFRETKARFIGGGWKLHSLYTFIDGQIGTGSDADIEKNIALIRQWKTAVPDSIAAQTALANAYMNYAWKARGDGYAAEVADKAWPIFNERMDKAGEAINAAKGLSQRCPEYYVTLLDFARAKNWGRGATRQAFDEAAAFEPEYQYIYTTMAVSLMPRWGGVPGEWETFADDVKNKIGGDHGLEIYYFMVEEVSDLKHQSFFLENHPSWADARQGFQLLAKEYGVSRLHLNEFARIALNARDAQTACKAFKLIQGPDDADLEIWRDKIHFDKASTQAAQYCSFPRFDNQAP